MADAAPASTADRTAMGGWRRNVALFLIGQSAALFGAFAVDLAAVWHLMLTTGSGAVMMWATIFSMVPQAVTSLFGGVWADRYSRKLLIIGSGIVMVSVSLALAFVMLNGVNGTWVIYLALAVRSAFAGVQQPAVGAILPQIVPSEQLLRVNGINDALQSVLFLAAPGAAGAIYAAVGIHAVFFVDVATGVLGIGLLAVVPVARAAVAAPAGTGLAGYFRDLAGGLVYVVRSRAIRWLMLLLGVMLLLAGAPMMLTTLMVVRSFGGEVWMVSGNEIAWGIGGLVGGLAVAALARRMSNRVAIIVASVIAAAALSIALGLSTNLWVFYAFGVAISFALAFETTPTTTILQETIEPEMQGRVFGFHTVVITTAMPLSMLVFGPLADRFSVESLLIAAGVLLAVFIGTLLAVPGARRSLAAIATPAKTAT
ncbi:MAG: MFS transporter [Microbacteriaceae bacterium]|nr:MFS transporter [Microbacteriaceae bacterium]